MDRHFLRIRRKISTETVSGGNAAIAFCLRRFGPGCALY
jgi:hypothetical protein